MNRRQLLHTMAAGPLAAVVANHTRAEAAVQSAGAAERLVVISLDGVRTQEMFGGLDADILQAVLDKKPANEHALYKKFWRPTR